ncbi:methyl-accepting chemotaxis protein [Silvibacterium sp.]|uniref:methyl-accepting chemotaxis protein n=1 Tax=Silvibacterium sp. TaxID=1964179 RepID=UPI0039E55989
MSVDSFAGALQEVDASAGPGFGLQMKPYLERLGTLGPQLQQTSALIETSVLDVCSSFQGVASRAKATSTRTVSFLANDGQSSGGVSFEALIQNCSDTLVTILEVIVETGDVSRRAVERVQQMDESAAAIRTSIQQLEAISRENRMLVINARIEAAHAGEQGAGFGVVAVEVASQTEKMQSVTALVDSLAAELRTLAASALADLKQMQQRVQQRVEQCRRDVEHSLDALRRAHQVMQSTLTGITEDGAALATEIDAGIRGMQFQDRVSQRIAHVVEDLEIIERRLHELARNGVLSGGDPDAEFSAYTMQEERELSGLSAPEMSAGDVELF